MEENIKIINDYLAARDTHSSACQLSREIDSFIEKEINKIPLEELKKIAEVRVTLSKYVWGDARYRAWDKVKELFKP